MNRLPFLGYPYRYYGYYPKYPNTNSQMPKINNQSNANNTNEPHKEKEVDDDNNLRQKRSSKSSPFTFNFDGFTSNDEAIITLFGIELFLDDLIILGLLYLLYQEEVKDEMLFICLLLLLIS